MAVVPDSFLEDVARRFALLGDPTRLKIVSVLHERGECPVGEIADAAGTSVANTSQHLQRLAAGQIVGRRRDGQAVCYRIVDGTIEQLCAIVCGSVAGAQRHRPDNAAEGAQSAAR
ncbi:MAG TPA: metalloregulator ArsR/SmtB family transcription factor [Streptosporangiaceae bacterium]